MNARYRCPAPAGSLKLVAPVLAILYTCYRRKDRRLLRNGLFLVGALWFACTGLLGLLTELFPPLQWVTIALVGLLPLAVLVPPSFSSSPGSG